MLQILGFVLQFRDFDVYGLRRLVVLESVVADLRHDRYQRIA